MPPKKPDYSYTEIDGANGIIKEISLMPSTIETIDQALFDFIDNELDLYTTTNKGSKKTPVIWVSAERAHQIKNDREIRDSNGSLKLPLITLERTSMTKDPAFKGTFQAHIPDFGASYYKTRRVNVPAGRRINQGKTSNFSNAFSSRRYGADRDVGAGQVNFPLGAKDKSRVVFETIYQPIPIWVKTEYSLKIRTEYIQQMNDLTQPFYTFTGQMNSFFINREGHRYESFVEGNIGYSNNVADLGEEERTYVSDINIRVLGYLMGQGKNDPKPKFSVIENYVDVKIPRERVIVGDINTFLDDDEGFYRE